MITPTQSDVGRKVVYRGHGGEVEEGTITSIRHPDKTFVRYGSGSTSALTKNAQLEWVSRQSGDQCPWCGNDYDPMHPCGCKR